MLKYAVVALVCMVPVATGAIDVLCSEFAPAQQDEIRAVVAAVEEKCSELFGVDLGAIDDGAKIEIDLLVNDYYLADERLNDGKFRSNWAFANADAMEAHVALQPPVPHEMLAAVGIPLQTKIQIAHETVHLCIYQATRNHGSHPGWFSEGLAVYLASESLRDAGQMGTIEQTPWTSTEIVRVQRYLADHPVFSVEKLLDGELKLASNYTLYALRGSFVAWLDEIGVLSHVFSEVRRFGGGGDFDQRVAVMTSEAIANAGIDNPDMAFRRLIERFTPQWDELYRSLQITGNEWAHSAFSSSNAVCWNSDELGKDNWTISGSMKIFDGEKKQLNVLLGRSDEGYLSVAFGPTFGITVFHRKYTEGGKKSNWIRLVNKEVKSMKLDEWMDFKISKRRNRLMIRIAKQRPVQIDLDGIDVSGAWGLGAQQKSSGLWRDVKVEK
ncbi:MAG: hypothetical protein JKY96_01200 [Phycisphaerales bacterium]|nr:hypothetical protein [Phycisphaerales bacterium]